VQLQPGLRVAGRVACEGDGPMPSDLSRVRVTLSAIQRPGGVTVGVGPVQATADGTFAFEGIVPGFYRLSAAMSGAPGSATWTLKSSVSGERESQDVGIEVAPARDITDAVVMLTNRPAELVGSLIDATGRPAPDFHVIAFSTDRAHWINQHWRVAQARPATNGAFRIAGLPPGDYFLGAVTDVEPDQIYDPTLLEQLQKSAVKFRIAHGEKTTQNLRIAGGG